MRFVYNGQVYGTDARLEIDNVNYVLRRLSPEKREALGITIAPEPPSFDSRYEKNVGGEIVDLPWGELKPRLIEYANAKKYEKEVGGLQIGEMLVPTDDRAKLLIFGATSLADDAEVPFVVGATDYGTRTGAEMKALHAAVVAHVQACIALYAEVLAGINAEEIATYEAVDAAFT